MLSPLPQRIPGVCSHEAYNYTMAIPLRYANNVCLEPNGMIHCIKFVVVGRAKVNILLALVETSQ